ncbi:hypothetical protein ACE1SV_68960 [Streptomyces sp. E-15]
MNTTVVKRPPRASGPQAPEGQIELAQPPVLGEPAMADLGSVVVMLPMGIGAGAMGMMFVVGGSTSSYMMSGMMGIGMMSMGLGQLGRAGFERKRRMRAERRDYMRYLTQLRTQVREAAAAQVTAAVYDNPPPRQLWSLVQGPRVWERRASHEDFAKVRIGLGTRRAALELVPPQTKPVEDLDPLTAISLRRFTEAFQTVPGMPIPVALRSFTSVEFAGDIDDALDLTRAMLAQLVALHSPDELRVAVLTDPQDQDVWEWVKWLPHNAHPRERDQAGPSAWSPPTTPNCSTCWAPTSSTAATTTRRRPPAPPSPSWSSSPTARRSPPTPACWGTDCATPSCSISPAPCRAAPPSCD